MDDQEQQLTEADRRAIAEIRRKLDAEFRQRLDAELGPLQHPGDVDNLDSPTRSAIRARGVTRRAGPRASHRRVVATLLLGMLMGTVLGGIGSFLWVRHPQVPAQEAESRNNTAARRPTAADEFVLLRDALEQWIEATRRGDITTQMRFYPARVPVYYTWRNVPSEAVRAEKVKVFGAASRLVITTDAPAVELARDGLTAVTRFRKQYVIEGPVVRRRGEVLQELSWTRTVRGWLIVGERDANVLRSG